MKLKSILVVCVLFALWGCNEDEDIAIPKGDIYVTVYESSYYSYSSPVEGATVFTVPATVQTVTDEFGTAMLKDVESGTYEIYASLSGYGSGKVALRVSPDSLNRVNILIVQGVNTNFAPEIELVLPGIPANFSPNENVVFSFNVTDKDSQPNDIDVVISSNLDGKLVETHPNASNNVRFETSSLSRGKHIITITATDKDKYSATKTIEVSTVAPSEIILESATKTAMGYVQLQWKKYTSTDFMRYEVFRAVTPYAIGGEGQLIASFTSADSIRYIDKMPPLVSEASYYVRISNKEDQSRNSNQIKVEEPAGKIYYYSITDAVHHPTEPIIYIVDNAAMKLRAINYVTQTEINNISLQGSIGNIDMGDNGFGLEIYVPNNSVFIHVYNANTLNLVTSIMTGLDTRCVVTNGHGYLVASLMPSPWWEQPIRTYSRATGINISGNGDFEGDRMRFIPNTDNIISISRQVSPIDMEYFELDNTGKILLHQDDSYHGDHPLDPEIFRISNNGEYVITGREGAVYSAASSMIYKGMIDRGSLNFSDFAFSNDGNTIYAGTSNRNSLQIVKYPQLTRTDEILIKGYPKYLFNFKDEIISISKTGEYSDNYVIERVDIK
ncbi:MAG: carboxypeptidase-like regulatory domain-containing protein [Candidatus Symbiothrix sp.]|jgi:hypothetical protein|nr:carboxypeptidase-like regulatory domain-containing protein [Candidatus Symbiothrix sp.]